LWFAGKNRRYLDIDAQLDLGDLLSAHYNPFEPLKCTYRIAIVVCWAFRVCLHDTFAHEIQISS
jgi:hypothetical protein